MALIDLINQQQGKLLATKSWDQQRIQVFEQPPLRWLQFDHSSVQSCINLEQPSQLILDYCQAMTLAILFQPQPRSLLNLGSGCGSFERFFAEFLPELKISSVESNKVVIELAQQHFQLNYDHPVINSSAESHLQQCQQRYDWIFCDLHQHGQHPHALGLSKFHQDAYRCLNSQGVYVINLMPVNNDQLLAWLTPLRKRFKWTLMLPIKGYLNVILFALKHPPADNSQLLVHCRHWQQRCQLNLENHYRSLTRLPDTDKT